MENTETKIYTRLVVEMPEVVYLKKFYQKTILLGGFEYEYDMYCTTTFKTKLYKYRRV